jgi:hypothetical protein
VQATCSREATTPAAGRRDDGLGHGSTATPPSDSEQRQPAFSGAARLQPVNLQQDPVEAIRPYLLQHEHIVWTGRPDPRRLFNAADAFLVPFSLIWGILSLGWVLAVPLGGAPVVLALSGIPLALFGQFFIWGRFIAKAWDRRRTLYAVTNQRVLWLRGGSLQALLLNQLPAMSCSRRRDGSGSIEFGSPPAGLGIWRDAGMSWFNRSIEVLAFRDIPELDRVCQMIAQRAVTTDS